MTILDYVYIDPIHVHGFHIDQHLSRIATFWDHDLLCEFYLGRQNHAGG